MCVFWEMQGVDTGEVVVVVVKKGGKGREKEEGKMRSNGELEGKIEMGVETDRNGKVNKRQRLIPPQVVFLAVVSVYL